LSIKTAHSGHFPQIVSSSTSEMNTAILHGQHSMW